MVTLVSHAKMSEAINVLITWTYFVKWLITVIVFTLSFLLLNLVITTSDPKDIYIYIYMNCPDVTMRCIKSHLYHAVFISTRNVFFILFMSVFIIVLHALSISTD